MKHLSEKRSIKSSEDALILLDNGKLAGRIGGKKFIPQWVLDDPDHFASLVDATLTLLGDDPNIASDELISFLLKCTSASPNKWEAAIESTPDALVALSQAFNTQWIKSQEWVDRLNTFMVDDTFYQNQWHDLEKDLIDILTARRAKKGRVEGNALYDTLYDDGVWKLVSPKSFEGDSEVASGMKPWYVKNEMYCKARWCTASGKGYWESYTTPQHSRMYVVQLWIDGEYVEAWQLVYGSNKIDFMDKDDHPKYETLLRNGPKEMLELIVDDNPTHLHMGINLYDISLALGPKGNVNAIYNDDEIKYSFFKQNLIHKNGFILTKGGIVIKAPDYAEEWDIPEGATAVNLSITRHAADSYDTVKRIKFPSTFKYIYSDSFRSFKSLESIEFLNIAKIGKAAFAYCYSLNSIKLPKKVDELILCSYSFFNCRSLPDINLPSGTTSIGRNSFGNTLIKKIYIPETCTHFNFSDAAAITHIALGNGMSIIPESSFHNCKALEWIKIPGSVRFIGEDAFSDCINLTNIDLPEGLVSIGDNAFCRSGLTDLKLPESLEIIKSGAFKDCRHLMHVTLPHNIKKFKGDAFRFCHSLSKVDNIEVLPRSAWLKVFPEYRGAR